MQLRLGRRRNAMLTSLVSLSIIIAGGYKAVDGAANDATINEAAKFAVESVRRTLPRVEVFFSFFFRRRSFDRLFDLLLLLSFSYPPTSFTSLSSSKIQNKQASKARNGPPLQLVRVVQAEQQVVAGMNYRLVLEAAPSANSSSLAAAAANSPSSPPQKPALYTAVVYQPLGAGAPMQLTSWKEGSLSA